MALLTGLSPESEQQVQDFLISRIATRAQRAIGREIARAMDEAGRLMEAGEPMAADLILPEHERRMTAILTRLWTAAGQMGVERLLSSLQKHNYSIERKQIPGEPEPIPGVAEINFILARWIRAVGGEKITYITQTTRNQIIDAVEAGTINGLDQAGIAKLIRRAAPGIGASRSLTIARTETHSASQSLSLDVARLTSQRIKKVWLASRDDRTRRISEGAAFDHLAAHRQTVDLDRAFVISGTAGSESLQFPGDPDGSAANVINCRCVIGYDTTA